jgi:hypothetical protein
MLCVWCDTACDTISGPGQEACSSSFYTVEAQNCVFNAFFTPCLARKVAFFIRAGKATWSSAGFEEHDKRLVRADRKLLKISILQSTLFMLTCLFRQVTFFIGAG